MTTKAKLASQRSPRWAFMERFEVPDYDQPERNYLTRWRIVQTPWFGIYLHRMDGPDPRTTVHDHPWSFLSIVLRGGYTEIREAWSPPVNDGPWRRNVQLHADITRGQYRRAERLHSIERLHRTPTWTLLFVGRRRRDWGYVDADGWTRFDRHRHAVEFDAAMAARKALS